AKDPVCACDGKAYDNECLAHQAGVDLALLGRCKSVVADFMPCGNHYCDAHNSYCEIYMSDVIEPPPDYECKPLPPACAPHGKDAASCDCFPPDTPCLTFCGPMVTGGVQGIHLTCQGKHKPRAH